MWGGVEGGTRVGDPLGADRRRPPHGVEGLRQCGLVPPPRPGRLPAGCSGRCPERLGLRTRAPSLRSGRDSLGLRGVCGGRDSLRSDKEGSGPRGVPGRDGPRGVPGGRDGLRGGEGGGGPRGLRVVRGGRDGGHKGGGGGQVCGRDGLSLRGLRGGAACARGQRVASGAHAPWATPRRE